jgi:uncharacterized protein
VYLPAPDEVLVIGVLRMVLRMPGNRSLKDRRRVVQSVRDRVHARHHAAFADVGHLERHDAAVIAVTLVGNDAKLLRSRLDTIRAEVEQQQHDALVSDSSVEMLSLSGHHG